LKCKLSIFILLLFSVSFAQVPGYLGKKFIISTGNSFSPSLIDPASSKTFNGAGFFGIPSLNSTYIFTIDYAISRKFNLCLSVNYLKTGVEYEGVYGNVLGSALYTGSLSTPIQLTSYGASIAFKVFSRGFVAPVGRYKKFDCGISFASGKYNNSMFISSDDGTPVGGGSGDYKAVGVTFGLTVGRQRIFFDKLTVDYGLRFALTGFISKDQTDSDATTIDYPSMIHDAIATDCNTRLLHHELVNFVINIGFIPF